MKNNYLKIAVALTIAILLFFLFYNDKDYKKKLNSLQKQIDSTEIVIKKLELKNDSLNALKAKISIEYKEKKIYLKLKENETDSAVNNVYTLSERQLDSTIRTYKHTNRPKN